MRVIAGALGGRRLATPKGRRTRPTSDRVREALFMSLEPLAGLRVVDLFAGSGALGIEALSRGALEADFVEPDRAAREALERNLAELGIDTRATVWRLELPSGLKRLRSRLEAADLVLVDPPYGAPEARGTLVSLGEPGLLKRGARVVFEHHAKDEMPERAGALTRVRERRYGETQLTVYGAAGPQPTPEEPPA